MSFAVGVRMHHLWRSIILIYLIAICFGCNANGFSDNNWSYKWTCGDEAKCQRIHNDNLVTDEMTYNSQNACRLVCGRYGGLWPRPTSFVLLGPALTTFNPNNLRFDLQHVPANVTDYMKKVNEIFLKNIRRGCKKHCTSTVANDEVLVNIIVHSNEINLSWETNESYRLDIVSKVDQVIVQIDAFTVFGARHGLETLSQLIAADDGDTEQSSGLHLVASARIEDRPVYRHRGLVLDTARNYLPISAIQRTINGMGASKLNVFHWHITDSQSFPLEIPSVPQLTRYGAYSPNKIYSPDNVRHIVEYAKLRGVRVIIEIDAPSHAGNGWNWGSKYGLGDLAVCVNQQPWRSYCIQPPCGQLNPANHLLFGVLRDIYKDLAKMLPSGETFHMGGDEVHFGCWNSTQEIVDFLYKLGLGRENKDFLQLWAEYQQSALRVWDEEFAQNSSSRRENSETPKKVILWSSQLTNYETIENFLDKERYIIQTWVESTNELPRQLLERGYELIISTKNAWYFDHGFWGKTPYYQWHTVYENRLPLDSGVLGGEACVWSELIDENNLDSRTWPRAAAVAERLWANPENPARMATIRFYRHNARLKALGIRSEPIAPKYCVLNEGQCN